MKASGFFLGAGLMLVAAIAFMALDKTQLHWYAAEPGLSSTLAASPDRVVGVELRCNLPSDFPPQIRQVVDREGCETTSSLSTGVAIQKFITGKRKDVTVRTASGGSYVVTVPPTTQVAVGDAWPQSGAR